MDRFRTALGSSLSIQKRLDLLRDDFLIAAVGSEYDVWICSVYKARNVIHVRLCPLRGVAAVAVSLVAIRKAASLFEIILQLLLTLRRNGGKRRWGRIYAYLVSF